MTRNREVIDSELRLLAAVRRTVADEGGSAPDIRVVDELLDERQHLASKNEENHPEDIDGGT
ncbi:hypothetical protein [Mycolicibacterium elephantis]|uniref:hypothetical protein n=1 Tax=Mycolicibacterium elephantis TaxID=81858 RepID=UPI0007EBD300|nr:hypothetical protein [Mycolicibacterium elephantis]OBB22132.1 hypothetical protein A5762_14635 [Mycolicibacterium elephantis]